MKRSVDGPSSIEEPTPTAARRPGVQLKSDGAMCSREVVNMNLPREKGKKNGVHYCPHEGCERSSHTESLRPFTTAKQLQDHHRRIHGEKTFACNKCNKKFSTEKLRDKHKSCCGLKYVCSCNVAYCKRRGFLEHIKRSKHEIPVGLKEYFFSKQNIKPAKKTNRIFVKNRATPVPILPKSLTGFKCRVLRPAVAPKDPNSAKSCTVYPKNCVAYKVNIKSFNKSLIKLCPVQTAKTSPAPNLSLDALSVAVQASGIQNTPVSLQASGSKSQTSQTSQAAAQDSSCQTEDFFAWLENESEAASDLVSSVNISTQTLLESSDQFGYGFSNDFVVGDRPATAQIETQTDDWASDLLNHGLLDAETCSSKCDVATSSQVQEFNADPDPQLVVYNDNNNNNTAGFAEDNPKLDLQERFYFATDPIISDHTSSIQTQTTLSPLNSHVTTQTGVMPEFCDASMSASLFDFLTHTETQTENDLFKESLVTTTHTQTPLVDDADFLAEFLNIETQTEF